MAARTTKRTPKAARKAAPVASSRAPQERPRRGRQDREARRRAPGPRPQARRRQSKVRPCHRDGRARSRDGQCRRRAQPRHGRRLAAGEGFGNRVQNAISKLGVPTSRDVRALSRRSRSCSRAWISFAAACPGVRDPPQPSPRERGQTWKRVPRNAAAKDRPRPRRGGPFGAIYEIGALMALQESLEGLDLNELDCYVGVSAGSFLAAALANGIRGRRDLPPLHRGRPRAGRAHAGAVHAAALREYAQRARQVPPLLARSAWRLPPRPFAGGTLESFAALGARSRRVSSTTRPSTSTWRRCSRSGPHQRLSPPLARLYLVATDLDSGESVSFGRPGTDHVPISKAVKASAALPGSFLRWTSTGATSWTARSGRRCTPRRRWTTGRSWCSA